jgi:hypothetical protein
MATRHAALFTPEASIFTSHTCTTMATDFPTMMRATLTQNTTTKSETCLSSLSRSLKQSGNAAPPKMIIASSCCSSLVLPTHTERKPPDSPWSSMNVCTGRGSHSEQHVRLNGTTRHAVLLDSRARDLLTEAMNFKWLQFAVNVAIASAAEAIFAPDGPKACPTTYRRQRIVKAVCFLSTSKNLTTLSTQCSTMSRSRNSNTDTQAHYSPRRRT